MHGDGSRVSHMERKSLSYIPNLIYLPNEVIWLSALYDFQLKKIIT